MQREPCFPVKRMLGPAQWRVSVRARAGETSTASSKKRVEPAATDTAFSAVHDAICPGMADGMPCSHRKSDNFTSDVMHVPVSNAHVLVYPAAARGVVPVAYGSYVVHAQLFGVPSQHGLRDYWRHAYLFKERALLSSFGLQASVLPATYGTAHDETPDAKERMLDERVVFTGTITDVQSGSIASGASGSATPLPLSQGTVAGTAVADSARTPANARVFVRNQTAVEPPGASRIAGTAAEASYELQRAIRRQHRRNRQQQMHVAAEAVHYRASRSCGSIGVSILSGCPSLPPAPAGSQSNTPAQRAMFTSSKQVRQHTSRKQVEERHRCLPPTKLSIVSEVQLVGCSTVATAGTAHAQSNV